MIRPVFWPDNKPDTQIPDPVIRQLTRLLSQQKVLLGDSDTVLGLYAPLTKEGFLALNNLKKRADKPYLVLVANKERALSLIANPIVPELRALMDACWPGPVTLICKARVNNSGDPNFEGRQSSSGYAVSGWGTIGLRVPDHVGLQELLPHFEGLFSTSANITGHPVPHSLEEVDPEIAHMVAGVVLNRDTALEPEILESMALDSDTVRAQDLGTDKKNRGPVASTILDCTALTGLNENGQAAQDSNKKSAPEIKLIREGAYPVSLIEERAGVMIKR